IEGSFVCLRMIDNGIGMEADVLARCTQPHFSTKRDDALHQGHASGMGLGLAFVSWVMEQHKGNLKISSQKHEGTTIQLFFPKL
ncbi:MAG TPA: ATP-binding protein, partial [Gemmatales bacterium]|nr:ATP-binding protein [Gemmatales bacterium]